MTINQALNNFLSNPKAKIFNYNHKLEIFLHEYPTTRATVINLANYMHENLEFTGR